MECQLSIMTYVGKENQPTIPELGQISKVISMLSSLTLFSQEQALMESVAYSNEDDSM